MSYGWCVWNVNRSLRWWKVSKEGSEVTMKKQQCEDSSEQEQGRPVAVWLRYIVSRVLLAVYQEVRFACEPERQHPICDYWIVLNELAELPLFASAMKELCQFSDWKEFWRFVDVCARLSDRGYYDGRLVQQWEHGDEEAELVYSLFSHDWSIFAPDDRPIFQRWYCEGFQAAWRPDEQYCLLFAEDATTPDEVRRALNG